MSHVTNNYKITNITEYKSTHSIIPTFGIHISFERDIDRINGIVITYHLMCGILVLVATINFLIDPKDTDGRGGLLVTVFLVLTTFFTVAQVDKHYLEKPNTYIFIYNLHVGRSRWSKF